MSMLNHKPLFMVLMFIPFLIVNGTILVFENSKTLKVPVSYHSIQEAINAAEPGDTVIVQPLTYEECIVVDKPIILVGADPATTVIDGKGLSHVITVLSDNAVIKGFTIRNSRRTFYAGIYLHQVNNISILNNIITNCSIGVKLHSSSNIQIRNNEIVNNSDFGIYIKHFSTKNLVCENKIAYNYYGVGLLTYSSENTVRKNSIRNNKCGIYLTYSKDNLIESNEIWGNSLYGINIEGLEGRLTTNNAIIRNNLTENKCGIYVSVYLDDGKTGNMIYQNNFFNNTSFQAFVEPPFFSENTWNLPYPLGGNYWSDYKYDDLFGGVYQNVSGPDGFGDKPYFIAQNNIDQYPLMHPYVLQAELEPQGGISYHQYIIAFILITLTGAIMYLILKKTSYAKKEAPKLDTVHFVHLNSNSKRSLRIG
ncbi:MAG: NosD domain-containing protein [Candidatus Bathyarchaeia archaeon]